jgi:glycosyltransferase involved in cell wall biosynthesis
LYSFFRLKILLVSHQLDFSGAPNALLSAARVLRSKQYELHLLSLSDGPLEAEFSAMGVRRIQRTDFRGYDLVILNTSVSARVASSIPSGIKYLLWLHESPLLFVHSDLPFIVSQAAERAIGILFPTESTAQEWARYGSLRSDVRHIFYSLAPVSIPELSSEAEEILLTRPTEMPSPLRIISIDPMEYFRGYRVISQALECLVSKGIDVHYTAVGASPVSARAVFPFLSSNRMLATDRIPRAEVLEHLARSHVYVSASSFATQNLGLCEATLMGIPSVISDIPVHRALSESMSGAVMLSRLFEWKSIAAAIEKLYANYPVWRITSRNAIEPARKYLSAQRMEDVIRCCLALRN